MKDIRMICMDLDGTLLDPDGRITEENAAAVRRAQEKGIICAIASGRAEGNVILMLKDANLVCPACVLNGGLVFDENWTRISSSPMAPSLACRLCDLLSREKLKYVLLGDRVICTSEKGFLHHSEERYGERMHKMGHLFLHGSEELRSYARTGTTYKFYLCEISDPAEIIGKLSAVTGIGLTRSGSSNIEIMPAEVSKAAGVRRLCGHYGIAPENVMCIGDEMNDLEMIGMCGVGVAMGNASPSVRSAADEVTLDNASSGVAHAIRTLALHE